MLENVPEPLRDDVRWVLEEAARLQARWPARVQLAFHAPDSVHNYHPYLFREAFPRVSSAQLRDLALASMLVSGAMLVRDAILDGHGGSGAPRALLRSHAMELEGHRRWQAHLPPHARFWTRYQELYAAYARANLESARFADGELPWSSYTEERAIEIARGRAGLACTTVDALAELGGGEEHREPLCRSLHDYAVARQLWDEIRGWKEHLTAGRPSSLIARVLAARTDLQARPKDEPLFRDFAREAHYRGHVAHQLELALRHLDAAETAVASVPSGMWHAAIRTLRRDCEGLRDDLARIVARNLRARAEPPGVSRGS
jgi:hypothetical protein